MKKRNSENCTRRDILKWTGYGLACIFFNPILKVKGYNTTIEEIKKLVEEHPKTPEDFYNGTEKFFSNYPITQLLEYCDGFKSRPHGQSELIKSPDEVIKELLEGAYSVGDTIRFGQIGESEINLAPVIAAASEVTPEVSPYLFFIEKDGHIELAAAYKLSEEELGLSEPIVTCLGGNYKTIPKGEYRDIFTGEKAFEKLSDVPDYLITLHGKPEQLFLPRGYEEFEPFLKLFHREGHDEIDIISGRVVHFKDTIRRTIRELSEKEIPPIITEETKPAINETEPITEVQQPEQIPGFEITGGATAIGAAYLKKRRAK